MSNTYLLLGAGAGIGYSTAQRFAAEGFRIVLAARDADSLDRLAFALRRNTSAVVEIEQIDVSNAKAVVACIRRHAESLRVLHYNAASLHAQNFLEEPAESITQDIAVGLSGGLLAIREAAHLMATAGAGTILLTGGGLALAPLPQYLTLGSCKAALRNAVQGLFPTLARQNVHIATLTIRAHIAPGSVEADLVAQRFWDLHAATRDMWEWEATVP